MSTKSLVGSMVAVVFVVVLLASALHWQRVLERGLPPRDDSSATIEEAHAKAAAFAKVHPGTELVPILGTGSMAPYIPAAPAGVDPRSFIAAWVIAARIDYADVTPGLPCLYAADWAKGDTVLHGALAKDGDGWIMSGLGNAHSEAHWRMTAENFLGVAVMTFVVKGSP